MDFYQKFEQLCYEHGESKTAALEAAGVNRSAVTRWKNGEKPSVVNANKLADHFGISVSELMCMNEPQPVKPVVIPPSEDEYAILEALRCASPDDREIVLLALRKYMVSKKII